MKRKFSTLSGLAMVLIFASACASGGMGDILGGGGTSSPSSYGTLRGTVDYVDVNNRSIVLTNVSGLSSMLSNSGSNSGSTVRVYFDNQTSIQYQGQGYRPEDLERGDEVDVRVSESGNQLVAETVTVVRDASPGTSSGGSNPYPQDTYGTTVTGTVRAIDVNRRTIELDRGYGNGTMIVEYDDRTPVSWNNQTYRPSDLERGDEVQVRITNLGSNRYRADTISVVRSVSGGMSSGGGIYGNTNSGTIRGTVRYVDTARRTIELESVNGVSGFNTGAGSAIVIQYGSNATIDVRGQQLPLSGLERGDVIEVAVDRSGSSYFGTRFVLVRDVQSSY